MLVLHKMGRKKIQCVNSSFGCLETDLLPFIVMYNVACRNDVYKTRIKHFCNGPLSISYSY